MSLFLCPRARPLTTGAAAAVRGVTKPIRATAFLGLAAPDSRWMSCAAKQRAWLGCRGHTAAWRQTPVVPQPRNCRRTLFSHHGIRDYEQLPKDYQDKVGLPFSSKELTDAEVLRIFGAGMKTGPANYLLRVLHGRRIAGTLDDPAYAVNTVQFTDEQMGMALAYLRKTVPIEEVRNAGLRAEDELMQMEEDMAKANKAKERKADGTEAVAEPDVPYTEDPVYGHSTFDQIRATNQAKQKARGLAEEKERLEREEREGIVSGTLAEMDQVSGGGRTRAITNPKIQAYYDEAQSDLTEPPQMSAAARILPSAVVVALVLGFMAAVSMVYEEPAERYRLIPELSTSQATVAAIVGLNLLVYMAWKVPPLWKHLNKYFIVSVATPRPLSMFTTIFSHQSLSHLVTNMLPLVVIGPALHDEMGRSDFLTLFLACGSLSFVGSLATYTLRGMLGTTTIGGSGATLGLCAAYFWEHRMDGFKFFGLPEHGVHGVIFLAGLLALQLAGLGKTLARKIDLASHLAGFAAGVASIEAIQRAARGRQASEGEGNRSVIEIWFWLKPWLHARVEANEAAAAAALAEAEAEAKKEKKK
ncbi:hypothetical protein LMH87_005587 [Akanthomyces muscarius]|uniref:Peptidase S54 rhomboid domain-containing protein n=1 Tax=Akanthomyces muscarius TaxID=2231603 RepID=A0A9W8US55_AKAMU|nr:hypothetical protein LMH87_005587 [Akanthomyces muscarius]KAJ4163883.1 hypothetical protein LMH87_005587 [Akanthomyces muscarius]